MARWWGFILLEKVINIQRQKQSQILARPSQVSVATRSLMDGGLIEKLDRGIYAKPSKVAQLARGALMAKASLKIKNYAINMFIKESRCY